MGEVGVGGGSATCSPVGAYEPEAALDFVIFAAGVPATTAGEVLRARDMALVQAKGVGGETSADGCREPTAAELLAWTVESLSADSVAKDAILDAVFLESGIRAEIALAVLSAEAEYMRSSRMVDDDAARRFREWAASKACVVAGPASIRGE